MFDVILYVLRFTSHPPCQSMFGILPVPSMCLSPSSRSHCTTFLQLHPVRALTLPAALSKDIIPLVCPPSLSNICSPADNGLSLHVLGEFQSNAAHKLTFVASLPRGSGERGVAVLKETCRGIWSCLIIIIFPFSDAHAGRTVAIDLHWPCARTLWRICKKAMISLVIGWSVGWKNAELPTCSHYTVHCDRCKSLEGSTVTPLPVRDKTVSTASLIKAPI